MRVTTLGLVVCILITFANCALGDDILMNRYTGDQAGYTSEKLATPLSLKWEFVAKAYENITAEPIVSEGFVYFACGDKIYCLDFETGSKMWEYPTVQGLAGNIHGTPVFYEDKIYFGCGDGNLYCLNAKTGIFQWAYQTRGAIRSSLVIEDGIIYLGSNDDSLYAVEAETGDPAWNEPFQTRDDIAFAPALTANMVIISSMDGSVYGVRKATGTPRWVHRLPMVPVKTSPIVSGNHVIMTVGSSMYGLSVNSGRLRWTLDLPTSVSASPAVDGNYIYIPSGDKKIYAVSVKGKKLSWQWTEPVDTIGIPNAPPTVSADTLYTTSSKGVLSAFSTEDGALKWQYIISPSQITKPGSPYTDSDASPVVSNGCLLVVTDDGVLHCFSNEAADDTAPMHFSLKPKNAQTVSGSPGLPIGVTVYDIGTGVDPSTISLMLDGETVEYELDDMNISLSYQTPASEPGKKVKDLADGLHTLKIIASDYKGNRLEKEWYFFADHRMPRRKFVKSDPTGKKTSEPTHAPVPSQEDATSGPPTPPPMPTNR